MALERVLVLERARGEHVQEAVPPIGCQRMVQAGSRLERNTRVAAGSEEAPKLLARRNLGAAAPHLRAQAVETRWASGLEGLAGEAYVELPLDDELEERVAELAERGLRAKVRCGGVEVPSRAALARFLRTCRDAGVPFKATAGLPHPLATAERHGFLNVLAACAFEDEDALEGHVSLTPEALRWGDRRAGADELVRVRREQLVAVGSCSFFEPVDELTELGIL